MTRDAFIGLFMILGALVLVVGLVLWCRWTIEFIARKGLRTARDIARRLEEGKNHG